MGEPSPGRLRPSTRINFGLLMVIPGFALTAGALLLGGMLGFGLVLPLLAGPVLLLTGLFQMRRGLRERDAPDEPR